MPRARLIAVRLAKAGFGTQSQILASPARLVLDAQEYVEFLDQYETTFTEMNKTK